MGKMWLPPIPPKTEIVELDDVSSVVLVGENGCGKSQIGAWIDNLNQHAHRVSAQRALTFGDYIQPRPLEQALRLLLMGSDQPNVRLSEKIAHRWRSNPIGHMPNDFEFVLAWLFAEHAKTGIEFREKYKNGPSATLDAGKSNLELALEIWQSVMPQRQLIMGDNKLSARYGDNNEYAARGMSDGERVALYLIGQCLASPREAILVIDEPEIHLHQAIQARLWDQLEAARPDCVFVYITHDLAFAASRATAKKIWIKSFDGKKHWEWEEVEPQDQFPESLVLRILGSRRPVLFVEGEVRSVDIAVYRVLFPERFVIPRSSCASVVNSTVALRSLTQLHHADPYGIIDRDHRTDNEIASYEQRSVFAPEVAEIENLFLLSNVIEFVSKHQNRNPQDDVSAVQAFLFDELTKELQVQINERATFQIQQRLNGFPGVENKKGSAEDFIKEVKQHFESIDPESIFKESEALFKRIVDDRNFDLLLKHYNRKSLPSRISPLLGFGRNEYSIFVVRLLQTTDGEPLRRMLRSQLPVIPPANES